MLRFVEPILGTILIVLVLSDVYLTVLYARIGTGIISHWLGAGVWRVFETATRPFTQRRDHLLSFAGPTMLVLMVIIWVAGLCCGGALVIHPRLGTSIQANTGATPTDFVVALYIAGDSLTTVGTSDISPQTPFFRLFYLFDSLIGITVLTLTMTYLLEIYNALLRRNTFAVKLHTLTGGSGDAVELVAGAGPQGRFDVGYSHLTEIAAEMDNFSESHHFYSVLLYFRFREPHYAMSRMALVVLDSVTLIKSALNDKEYAWLKQSAAVNQLWRTTMQMLTVLAQSFLPKGVPEVGDDTISQATLQRWRDRYRAACQRLREAGIATIEDEDLGAEIYISLRARWDRFVTNFAHYTGHQLDTVDPAARRPDAIEQRPSFQAQLHATS
jgi:hypothetical protein